MFPPLQLQKVVKEVCLRRILTSFAALFPFFNVLVCAAQQAYRARRGSCHTRMTLKGDMYESLDPIYRHNGWPWRDVLYVPKPLSAE
jgi:hypothetical protein